MNIARRASDGDARAEGIDGARADAGGAPEEEKIDPIVTLTSMLDEP